MHKWLAVLALVAAPALAQDSGVWPVSAEGRACTASQPGGTAENGRLSVTYDAARQEVVLTSLNRVQSPLPQSGSMNLQLVFLDNGDQKWDDGWGPRQVNYVRTGDVVQFTTRFVGEKNVRQVLADLSSSKRIGLLDKREPVIAYFLDGFGPTLAQLRDCAARAAGGAA
jgi:hypothetical protein